MLRYGFPPQQQRFARASVQSIEAQAFLSFAKGRRFSRGMLAALMFRHPLRSSKAAAALLCLFAALLAQALPATAAPRYAAMAIDANTGSVLHNQAGDEPRYPASLTKMMTLYMTVRGRSSSGRRSEPSTSQVVRIRPGRRRRHRPSSRLRARHSRSPWSMRCWALVTKSANDAAVASSRRRMGWLPRSSFALARADDARRTSIGMTEHVLRERLGPARSGAGDDGARHGRRSALASAASGHFPRHYELFSTRVFNYGGELPQPQRSGRPLPRHRRHQEGIYEISSFNHVASVPATASASSPPSPAAARRACATPWGAGARQGARQGLDQGAAKPSLVARPPSQCPRVRRPHLRSRPPRQGRPRLRPRHRPFSPPSRPARWPRLPRAPATPSRWRAYAAC